MLRLPDNKDIQPVSVPRVGTAMNSIKRVFSAPNVELRGETKGFVEDAVSDPPGTLSLQLEGRGKVHPLDAPGEGFLVDLAGHHRGLAPAPQPRSGVPVCLRGAHPTDLQQPGSAPVLWGSEPHRTSVGAGQRVEKMEVALELVGHWRAWRVLRS